MKLAGEILFLSMRFLMLTFISSSRMRAELTLRDMLEDRGCNLRRFRFDRQLSSIG